MSARRTTRLGRAVAFAVCSLVLLASCHAGPDRTAPVSADRAAGPVVVASFNFSESELLAAIYGLAMSDPAAIRAALARALGGWHVQVMAPAAAQDQNGIVVTGATARRLGLRKVSDLRRAASRLVLGGAPECPDRPYCLPGLRTVYGLGFARFLPFDTEPQRVTALREGVVDVVVLDTTDGNLATGDLILLADDRHLQPAENVVPVITTSAMARYGKRLAGAVNAVSAQLTS